MNLHFDSSFRLNTMRCNARDPYHRAVSFIQWSMNITYFYRRTKIPRVETSSRVGRKVKYYYSWSSYVLGFVDNCENDNHSAVRHLTLQHKIVGCTAVRFGYHSKHPWMPCSSLSILSEKGNLDKIKIDC